MRVPSSFRPGPLPALGIAAVSALNVGAQDAAITNARIIIGNGAVIALATAPSSRPATLSC